MAARRPGARHAARRSPTNSQERLEVLSEAITRAYFSHVPAAQAVGSQSRRALMQYLLSHRTSYSYASSVDSAHHIAHLRARDVPRPEGHVRSASPPSPSPRSATQHLDHFGNHIDIYRIDKPHKRFDIEVRAAVEVQFPDPPPRPQTPPWEKIRATLYGDGFPTPIEASEFVYNSPLVPIDRRSRRLRRAIASRRAGRSSRRPASSRRASRPTSNTIPAPPTSRTPLARGVRGQGRRLPGLRPCDDRGAARARPRRPATSRATSAPFIRRQSSRCAAPTPATPGSRCGAASEPAGSISTRPTTWSPARTMSPSPGAATSPT